MKLTDRIQHAWDAFMNKDPTRSYQDYGIGYSNRPDRLRLSRGNERTIITAIYNRLAIDASSISIQHVRLDDEGRFKEIIDSGFNDRLNLSANLDQTGREFMKDVYMSMFDEGAIAIVPVETDIDPTKSSSYDILQLRVGKIVQWYPKHVKVNIYNENDGKHHDIVMPKDKVYIVENPFYEVMNEPNSTLQRLKRKLTILDLVDEQSGSGKLDLIIQLPYSVKSELRRQQAEERLKNIEMQLTGSRYGIAYIDSTEHVTQLNRAVENNLLNQIKDLTETLYSQLGLTLEIMNGTANEETMNNYYNRTIEPIVSAPVDEMKRKFLTKTARTQGQSIKFYRDPFKLVPITQLAELADKFTRNEIMTSNEFRQIVGMKPANDPKADELRNSNISQQKENEGGVPVDNGQPAGQSSTDPMDVLANALTKEE